MLVVRLALQFVRFSAYTLAMWSWTTCVTSLTCWGLFQNGPQSRRPLGQFDTVRGCLGHHDSFCPHGRWSHLHRSSDSPESPRR